MTEDYKQHQIITMKPINTALCSFGMSGTVFHAPFLKVHPAFNFYGVWERSKKIAAEKYPGVKSYSSFEELLADEAVELVVVNTPNYTHYDYTKQALLAGKHVVVEKPFCNSIVEAEELMELAGQQSKVLAVYHNRRFDSDYKTLSKVVHEGLLGDIVEAEFHFDRYKEELSPKQHKEVPGPGTGIVYDLGSHIIDQAVHLFGMPQALFADIGIQRPISQVDDYFELLMFYPNLRVRLKGGYLVREPLPSYVLHGTKGSFIKSRGDVQEAMLQAGVIPEGDGWGKEPDEEMGLLHTKKDGTVIRERIPTERGHYGEYYEQVFQAIRNDKRIPVSAEDGLNIIKIIEVAYESNREKRIVEL
jgi:scyllo-inositol 2-dehydrogenase (NADP+)